MQSGLLELIEYIRSNFPKDSADICDALDLLNLALEGLLDSANTQISEYHKNKDYDKTSVLLKISKEVSNIQSQISECAALLNIESEIDEQETAEEPDIFQEQKTIPNYAEYVVDSSTPHSLYEDYTHKKATAFSINGKKYEAKDWKDVLMQTCNILSEIDADKFYSFIDDPVMKGRKVSYFGRSFVEKKNAKMKNIDIYVWTNLSANHIKSLIRKLLKKFGIKISDYYIYLRADYTPLHRADNVGQVGTASEEKIGKYVRLAMRRLSDKQQRFSNDEMKAMQLKEWSKEVLGLDYPLLKPYIDGVDISLQIKVSLPISAGNIQEMEYANPGLGHNNRATDDIL